MTHAMSAAGGGMATQTLSDVRGLGSLHHVAAPCASASTTVSPLRHRRETLPHQMVTVGSLDVILSRSIARQPFDHDGGVDVMILHA